MRSIAFPSANMTSPLTERDIRDRVRGKEKGGPRLMSIRIQGRWRGSASSEFHGNDRGGLALRGSTVEGTRRRAAVSLRNRPIDVPYRLSSTPSVRLARKWPGRMPSKWQAVDRAATATFAVRTGNRETDEGVVRATYVPKQRRGQRCRDNPIIDCDPIDRL